jgi:hypothetical protein
MSEFSDQSNSFDGEYIPEHPDTEHAKYNGSDPMTPPDFYPGQADQQPTMHPDAEIDTAPFTTEFHPPDHPEVRFEDVQPVTEATKYELMDVILAIADEGMHVPELRDDKGIVIHEFVAHVLVTADDEEELRVHFYPKGVPKPKGDPLIGSVTIKPKTDNALAAFSQTI